VSHVGYIPKRLVFVYSDSRDVDGLTVTPAYPVDAENEGRIKSAEEWAKGKSWQAPKKSPVQHMELENGPFGCVVIHQLEHRMEGGRAYKVAIEFDGENFYFDFREDMLLWVIRNKGVQKGGVMNGEFCFAVVGSQMKLVPIGSPLHKEMAKGSDTRKMKSLSKKDFKYGHLYKRKNGTQFLYFGECQYGVVAMDNNCGGMRIKELMPPKKGLLIFEAMHNFEECIKNPNAFKIVSSTTAVEDCGAYDKAAGMTLESIAAPCKRMLADDIAEPKRNFGRSGATYTLSTIMPLGKPFAYDENLKVGTVVWKYPKRNWF
jgi:hypothetical protein